MNKLFIAILVLWVPLLAVADEAECTFPVGMVKQLPPPNAAAVAAYQWSTGHDKEFRLEHIPTLRILYKNGDHAVIQYRYCTWLNFEIDYFRNRQADDLDAKAIAILIASLHSQYHVAPEKVTFTKPLAEIIATTFREQKFDKEKVFDYGLPYDAANYPHPELSVDYSIAYTPLNESSTSGIYSSVTRFNMGVGVLPD